MGLDEVLVRRAALPPVGDPARDAATDQHGEDHAQQPEVRVLTQQLLDPLRREHLHAEAELARGPDRGGGHGAQRIGETHEAERFQARLERLLRQVLLAQAHQGDVEPGRIEAGNHPAEEPLHAVHAGAFPAEVIADLQDVEFPHRACPAGGKALFKGT